MARIAEHVPDATLIFWAKPGDVRGLYEGKIIVSGRRLADVDRLFEDAFAGLRKNRFNSTPSSFTYKPGEVSRLDPYRAAKVGSFEDADRDAIARLRKVAVASFVARSGKVTERALEDGLCDRRPLRVPTMEMWRAAIDAARGGFAEPAPDWLVEKVFMGEQEPARPAARDVAYQLMREENARRASLK